jgi:hypothetical protein
VIEDGRVRGEADLHVEVLAEVGLELEDTARRRMLEGAEAGDERRDVVAPPTGPVLGTLWIERAGSNELRWSAEVPLHNVRDGAVDADIAIELYDHAGEYVTVVGPRSLGEPPSYLTAGEKRLVRPEGRVRYDEEIRWAEICVRSLGGARIAGSTRHHAPGFTYNEDDVLGS